jgi:tetratricopeptide (TPR) repeat protein/energy-coupling factor transporter ATP-binding protein EcfA2
MMPTIVESKQIKNPFPGLRPFETDEYRLFFGREGQSDALIARLQRSRFLAIVGTSGSGKSSLVRAGLLPALRGGMMAGAGSGWRIAIMRPGSDPLGNLAFALADKDVLLEAGGGLPPAEAEAVIEASLRSGSLGLVEATKQARLAEHEKLLVVVDQFEELFRFRAARAPSNTDDDAAAFVKLLLEASQQRELSIYIVPTMRSDFLGDCAQFQGLPEAINDGQYLIPRMTRDERRVAITGPIGVTRGKVTEPLVNRLMNDVGDNPDQLPILQHALMRTWDYWAAHRRNGEPLGLEHYEAVGTMSDALSEHADEAFKELPDQRSRLIAEVLFKALTERGADNREIRRPTSVKDICEIANASAAEVITVIEVFRGGGRSFLMPPAEVALQAETIIDISHESLIRNWRRLKEWVNEEAQSARIYRRLAEASVLHREGSEGLLQDPALQIALDWREKSKANAAWARRYHPEFEESLRYLDESRAARDVAIAERERQREEQIARERRELEQAQLYAEQQYRAAQRLRRFTFALVLISLFALTAAGASVYAYALARRSKTHALEEQQKAERLALDLRQSSQKLAENYEKLTQEKTKVDTLVKNLGDEKKKTDKALVAEQAAVENQKKALALQKIATTHANEQRLIAEDKTRQVAAAVKRGELIRSGLESYRREDFNKALEDFKNLQAQLKPFRTGATTRPTAGPVLTTGPNRLFTNDYGWTLSHLGDTYHRLKKFDEAIENYEESRRVLEEVLKDQPAPILFETYHGLAHAYHDNAVERSAPSRMIRDAAWEKLTQEQFAKAEEFYKKALAYQPLLKTDNPLEAVVGLKNLAQLYTDVGNFEEAEKKYQQVVEIYKTVEYRPGDGTLGALKELAEFERGQGRYQDAARTYNELLDIQEGGAGQEDGMHSLADNYSDLGQVYSSLKDEERAEAMFQLADKLQQFLLKSKQIVGKGLALNDESLIFDIDYDNLGDAYQKAGRFAQAKDAYENALHIRQTEAARGKAQWQSFEKLANLYNEHLKDYDKAEEFYRRLIQEREFVPDEYYTNALRQLGVLYATELDRPADAEELFKRALTAFAAVDITMSSSWEGEDATYSALIDLYRRQKKELDLEQAYAHRLEALNKRSGAYIQRFYRTSDLPAFVAAYVKASGEVAEFYLGQKRTSEAEAAYRSAFEVSKGTTFRFVEPQMLADYAATFEKYQALLGDLKKPAEATTVGEVLVAVRARQKDLEQIRKQQEIEKESQQGQSPP